MRRCDYCGGKLGLIVHRKWRRRFCKLACRTAYECRQREDLLRRRQRLAYPSGSARRSLRNGSQHRTGGSPKPDASTSALKSGLLAFKLTSDPFEGFFAPTASFARSSICTRARKRYLPPSGLMIEASSSLVSNQFLPGTSIGLNLMSKLFLPLSDACASILRSASARIAERFCQLLSPVVEVSLLSDVAEIEGIGARLFREGRAMPGNGIVPPRTLRSDQLLGFSYHALLFLRLRQGGLW
jgi:hypothetical protein